MPEPNKIRWLRDLLAAHEEREASRLQRMSSRPADPGVGDLYCLPLPLPAPDSWCVTSEAADRIDIAPVDDRPFHDPTDLWTEVGGSPICIRLAAPCSLSRHQLTGRDRIDHLARFGELLSANPRPSTTDRENADDAERLWRHQVARAARVLDAWLTNRSLELDVSDLRDEASFSEDEDESESDVERDDDALQWPAARMVACSMDSRALLGRAFDDQAGAHRWEELACDGGRLILIVSPRGVGFRFEPLDDAAPPRLFQGTNGALAEVSWVARGPTLHAFWNHDWALGPSRARIDTAGSFFLRLTARELWS